MLIWWQNNSRIHEALWLERRGASSSTDEKVCRLHRVSTVAAQLPEPVTILVFLKISIFLLVYQIITFTIIEPESLKCWTRCHLYFLYDIGKMPLWILKLWFIHIFICPSKVFPIHGIGLCLDYFYLNNCIILNKFLILIMLLKVMKSN